MDIELEDKDCACWGLGEDEAKHQDCV